MFIHNDCYQGDQGEVGDPGANGRTGDKVRGKQYAYNHLN